MKTVDLRVTPLDLAPAASWIRRSLDTRRLLASGCPERVGALIDALLWQQARAVGPGAQGAARCQLDGLRRGLEADRVTLLQVASSRWSARLVSADGPFSLECDPDLIAACQARAVGIATYRGVGRCVRPVAALPMCALGTNTVEGVLWVERPEGASLFRAADLELGSLLALQLERTVRAAAVPAVAEPDLSALRVETVSRAVIRDPEPPTARPVGGDLDPAQLASRVETVTRVAFQQSASPSSSPTEAPATVPLTMDLLFSHGASLGFLDDD